MSTEIEEDKNDATTNAKSQDDFVVSEVNTFLVVSSEISPIVRNENFIAKLSCSRPVHIQNTSRTSENEPHEGALKFDKDGDLVVQNRTKDEVLEELFVYIEYENSTSLSLVGKQIWRGALLLADFIIHNASKLFAGKNILELGSGTGISSVVASFYASKVVATDLNEPDILNLIKANFQHNQKYVKSEFLVKPLDFLELNWSSDLENYIAETDVILAADVVYYNKITEGFVQTLKKCLTTGKPKNIFIALEKRYVFTISDLDVVAPMYDNFMDLLESILNLSPSPADISPSTEILLPTITQEQVSSSATATPFTIFQKYRLVPVCLEFPQYFSYERTKELVIWNIQPKV